MRTGRKTLVFGPFQVGPDHMQAPATSAETVIFAEDDAALRDALRFSLETDGFQVMTCDTGEALLSLSLPRQSACLMVDVHLGQGMTGLQALDALRERGVELPAIVVTTDAKPAMRTEAARLHAMVLEKPFLGDSLFGAIRSALVSQPQVLTSN